MTHDDHRQDSYAKIYKIGEDEVSIDYYALHPKPGPLWIFTIKRRGIERIYMYSLRPNHELELLAARTNEQKAHFLHRHAKASEPVKTVKRGEEK
jgi:hypothetical protein